MTLKENYYDFIIAGAGCSGLSLLWHLLHSSLRDKKILVIDSRLSNPDDKIWSYWGKDEHPFRHLNARNWDWLKIEVMGSTYLNELQKYPYHSIRSRDYHEYIIKEARIAENVTFLESEILEIKNDESYGILKTSKGTFKSTHIFQSIQIPKESINRVNLSVRQHFVGWEIKTKRTVFDPRTVTLMDFRPIHKNAVCFYYILPFNNNHALVEYTLFSKSLLPYDNYTGALKDYMKNDLGLEEAEYKIIREEKGNIPMEDRIYPFQSGDYIFNIGAVGGLTKPTTGYTFKQIQQFIPKLVNTLENNELERFRNTNRSPIHFLLFDRLFLHILQTRPDVAVQIFHDLFRNNPIDRVLGFLCNETNWKENLQIMWSVPRIPFLKALWDTKSVLLDF